MSIVAQPGIDALQAHPHSWLKGRENHWAVIGWQIIVPMVTRNIPFPFIIIVAFCSCEGSKDRAICCRMRTNQLQCPTGRSPYLYGKRPLACPSGSKRSCPSGYECSPSWNGGNQHLCCSTPEHSAPECVNGFGYIDPGSFQIFY